MGVNLLREDPIEMAECVGFAREFHNWVIDEGKFVQDPNSIIQVDFIMHQSEPVVMNTYPLFDPADVCLDNQIGTFDVLEGEFNFPGGTFDVFSFTEFAFFQACSPTIDLKNFRIWYFDSENCFNMEDDDGDMLDDCADMPVCDCTQGSPSYPNQQFKWNAPYQSQSEVDFDYFYDILNSKGLQISPSMMGSLPQLAQGEAFLNRLPIQWTGIPYNPVQVEPRGAPSSYIERADWMYQYVTRYGNNANAPICELKYHPQETPEQGRGNIQYIESWNEPDRTWEGNAAEFTASEYAAMASCDYDGHGGTLSAIAPGCDIGSYPLGVIEADPSIKFVMGAPFELRTDWLDEMNTWFQNNRSDGAFIFDVINFHHYSLPENDINGDWMSPEEDLLKSKLADIRDYAINNLGLTDKEFWLSEFGYDTDQNSAIGPEFPVALEAAVGAEKLQAQWTVRSFLEIAASGFDRAMVHDLRDATFPDDDSNWDQTTGLLLRDGSPKEAWYYVYSMKNILEGYTFHSQQIMGNCDEHFFDENGTGQCPRIYKFQRGNNSCDIIWAIWNPSASNITEFDLDNFELACGTSATGIKLKAGSINGELVDIDVTNGMATIPVSEDPIFIVEKELEQPECVTVSVIPNSETCKSVTLSIDLPLNVNYNSLQIWYGKENNINNANNPDFSPFNDELTLFQHDVSIDQSTVIVSGLEPETNYYFYVIPQTDNGIPSLLGFPNCRAEGMTSSQQAICALPLSSITILEDEGNGKLFDQQNLSFCGTGLPNLSDNSIEHWINFNDDDLTITLELDANYKINQFYIYDGVNAGVLEFNWSIDGTPNSWQPLTSYYTNGLFEWVSIANFEQPIEGIKFLQIINNNKRANIKELFICADPVIQCNILTNSVEILEDCNAVNFEPSTAPSNCNTGFNVLISPTQDFSIIHFDETFGGNSFRIPRTTPSLGNEMIPGTEYFYQIDGGTPPPATGSFETALSGADCFDFDPELDLHWIHPGCRSIQFRAFNDSQAHLYKNIQIWYTEASNGPFVDGKHPEIKNGVQSLVTQFHTVNLTFGGVPSYPAVTISGLTHNTFYYFAYRMLDGNGGSTPLYIMNQAVGTANCYWKRFAIEMGPMVANCKQIGVWWTFEYENAGGHFEIIETNTQTEKPDQQANSTSIIVNDRSPFYYYQSNAHQIEAATSETAANDGTNRWLYFRYVDDRGVPMDWIEWDLSIDPCRGELGERSIIGSNLHQKSHFERGIQLYPNPTQNLLFLKLEDNRYQEYQILDLMGRLRYEGKVNTEIEEMKLNLSNLPGGVYTLQMRGESVRWQSFKFVLSE